MGYVASLNHGGIILLPKSMAERDVVEGKLRRLLVNYKISNMSEDQKVYLVYTKESSLLPRVKAVINAIIENCG